MNIVPFEFRDKKLDLDKYEEQLGFIFPPIYRSFLSNFKMEPRKEFAYLKRTKHEAKFIDSDYRLITTLVYSSKSSGATSYEDDELGLMYFKSIDKLLEFCIPDEKFDGMDDDMIFISEHGSGDSLMLGIGESNKDKIFLFSEIRNIQVGYVADNIFDFLGRCQILEYHSDEMYYDSIRRIDKSSLYKNWGEDFWRVKENIDS